MITADIMPFPSMYLTTPILIWSLPAQSEFFSHKAHSAPLVIVCDGLQYDVLASNRLAYNDGIVLLVSYGLFNFICSSLVQV